MSAAEGTPLLESGKVLAELEKDGLAPQSDASSDKTSSNWRLWSRRQMMITVALCLQNFSVSTSFALIAPFYPVVATRKGVTPMQTGFIFGVFQLTVLVTSPLYGNFIHKMGAKFTFLAGCLLLGASSLAFGFLDECPDGAVFITLSFLCRIVEANGSSMLYTASFSIIGVVFSNDLGKASGLLASFRGAGVGLGPCIGSGLYAVGGYKLPFIVLGAFVFFNTALCYFLIPGIDNGPRRQENFLQLLKIPGCIVMYFVISSVSMALTFLEPTFSEFMLSQHHQLTVAQVGLLFTITPTIYAIIGPLVGLVADKGWLAPSTVFGLVACAVSFMFVGPAPFYRLPNSVPVVSCALAVLGIGASFALITAFPLTLNVAREGGFTEGLQTLGVVSGLFNSGWSFGGFAGPIGAGWLSERVGFQMATTICSAAMMAMASIFLAYTLTTSTLRKSATGKASASE